MIVGSDGSIDRCELDAEPAGSPASLVRLESVHLPPILQTFELALAEALEP